MKKLVAAFSAVFFMCVAFACTDDVGPGVVTSDTAGEAIEDVMNEASDDAVVSEGEVESQEVDVTSETDTSTSETEDVSGEEASDVEGQSTEVDVPELPADPTEDPSDQGSAYYSFPDWEVPPSNDDNR